MVMAGFPAIGRVYIDAQVIIYSVEQVPGYWPLLIPFWDAVDAGKLATLSSELSLLEVLVGPLKAGNMPLVNYYENLMSGASIQVLPVTTAVLKRAANLRAVTNIKTPDSIHAATALETGCDCFLTNDKGFNRVPNLPVLLLSDLPTP